MYPDLVGPALDADDVDSDAADGNDAAVDKDIDKNIAVADDDYDENSAVAGVASKFLEFFNVCP